MNYFESASAQTVAKLALVGLARVLNLDGLDWFIGRAAYYSTFPDAMKLKEPSDYRFVAINVMDLRLVAGFGTERSIDDVDFRTVLRACA